MKEQLCVLVECEKCKDFFSGTDLNDYYLRRDRFICRPCSNEIKTSVAKSWKTSEIGKVKTKECREKHKNIWNISKQTKVSAKIIRQYPELINLANKYYELKKTKSAKDAKSN
jgi:hypothetical protein